MENGIKETLEAARSAAQALKQLNRERDVLRERAAYAGAIDYSRPVVKSGSGRGSVERIAIQLADIDERIAKTAAELQRARTQAAALIDTLDSKVFQDVLTKRYVELQGWDTIAAELHYSYRHVFRLHRSAITELENKSCPIMSHDSVVKL